MSTVQAVSPAPDGGYPGGNTAEGQAALLSLTTGGFNTAIGWFSLRSNTTNSFNTGVGAGTLPANTADANTATGAGALLSNTIGFQNTANGAFALFENTTGNFNTAVGLNALSSNTTGSGNISLGHTAGGVVTTANNVICIGAPGANLGNSCYIGQIFGQPVNPASAVPVFVDNTGKLGTAFSSRRFKHDIKPMDKASESILAFKPVTFQYKTDSTNTPQFGLIAEEVADVNPDLVVRDQEGKPYSVRYDQVNAMLLNEFLKEHRKVEQLTKDFESKFAQQQQQIQALTAGLEKVSAQLEASKPAPRMVLNNP